MLRRILLLLSLVVAAAPAFAAGGMVSAADPRAAEAGREILRAGGSAADAAVATALALTVVEPQSSGIGGGGFLVYSDAATRRLDSFDGREASPAAAGPHYFYDAQGEPLSHADAVPGGKSVGVPGTLRLMALVHAKHGRLAWARLFDPAIRLARDGFAVTPRLVYFLSHYSANVISPWARAHFYGADGQPLPVGTMLKNPELAALLAALAARGPDYFYTGPPARSLVATLNGAARNPSPMTLGDLASYDAKQRPVVCGRYRGYRVCGMGPPSSGGIALLAILKQLERFDLAALGKDNPVAWHLIAESMRLASVDRLAFVGDPDFARVPVRGMLDPAYLAARSRLIAPDRAIDHVTAGTPPGAPPRLPVPAEKIPSTSHVVAVDGKGDVASYTSTIEGVFGSGLTVDGYFLNNELTDFDIVPDADGALIANRVEGGKRPRSAMTPTIVYGPDGKFRIAIGAAGGATIIAQVAKALVGVIDWHLTAQQAIALPQIVAAGDDILIEPGSSLEAMASALRAFGHRVAPAAMLLKANAVERVDGAWRGAADPRSEGVALAE